MSRARPALLATVAALVLAAGCAEISTNPEIPASIEAVALPFPSIAIGDSLRDTLGVAYPVRAIVRNIGGDVIDDAPIRYLYVQNARDTALLVDSVSGHVFADAASGGTLTQVAARFSSLLQVLIPIRITNAPDSAFRTDSARLVGFVPDTGRRGVDSNSVAVTVRAQYQNAAETYQNSADWLVRFAIVRPANLTNDTTAAVFLVHTDNTRPSQLDTTGTDGLASRRVRVRPSLFPAAGKEVDTVEVEAVVMRRGVNVRGSPVRIIVPVFSQSTRGG
jgi:hypothetical protein